MFGISYRTGKNRYRVTKKNTIKAIDNDAQTKVVRVEEVRIG